MHLLCNINTGISTLVNKLVPNMSRKTAGKTLAQQVNEQLAANSTEEVSETTTRTTKRVSSVPAAQKSMTLPSRRASAPRTRLTAAPAAAKPSKSGFVKSQTTTVCTTTTETPTTAEGVAEALKSKGYTPEIFFAEGGRSKSKSIKAVQARSVLGESVLVVIDNGEVKNDVKDTDMIVQVLPAEESPIEESLEKYYTKELIEKPVNERIDTDLAIMNPEGFTVLGNDGEGKDSWVYESPENAADQTGVNAGTFELPSVRLSQIQEMPGNTKSIIDMLDNPPASVAPNSFNILGNLLKVTGLDVPLREGIWTLLAPTDAAFGKLDATLLNKLQDPKNIDMLRGVLEYHVYQGRLDAETVMDQPTLQGESIQWDKTDDEVTANGVDVLAVNWMASNGVIHVLGGVLQPKSPENVIPNIQPAVDATNINDTTQLIRRSKSRLVNEQLMELKKTREELDKNLDIVASKSRGTYVGLSDDTLARTKMYISASKVPSRRTEALKLNEQVAYENETIERLQKDQAQLNALIEQLKIIDAEVRNLSARMQIEGRVM